MRKRELVKETICGRLSNFKYPKIMLLILTIILAYLIFRNSSAQNYISSLGILGYLGVFIAGMLFAFGFTAPFAVGFFISLSPSNIWLAGIIGGFGALLADLIIFHTIKISFQDEFDSLKKIKALSKIEESYRHAFK